MIDATRHPRPEEPPAESSRPGDGNGSRGGLQVSPARRLEETLEGFANRRLAVFIKGFPDPDSIASALCHRYIAASFGVDVDIVHFEQLSHHENRALVKRLDIGLTSFSDELDLSEYAGACFVDTQTPDLPITLPEGMRQVSLVDHHRSVGPVDVEFVDVREDSGSTCAIYAEYLAQGRVGLEPGSPEAVQLATALMYGIRSDTDDFHGARPLDFTAAAYLSPFVDQDLLRSVSAQSISAKSMDILQVALEKKIIRGNYLLAGVAFVRDEDRDGIAQAADYLLRRQGVDTVLVYGVVGGEKIDGSFRTTSNTVDPDAWMKDLFGLDQSGRAYGGGRRDKGGFQIPLNVLSRCSNRDLLWAAVACTVEDAFFEKIGASRDEE